MNIITILPARRQALSSETITLDSDNKKIPHGLRTNLKQVESGLPSFLRFYVCDSR